MCHLHQLPAPPTKQEWEDNSVFFRIFHHREVPPQSYFSVGMGSPCSSGFVVFLCHPLADLLFSNPSVARLPTDVVREALTSWAAHCCALYATCLTGCLHVVLLVKQQNRYRRRVRPKPAKLGPHTYRGCVCAWNPPVSRAANLPHPGRLGVRLTGCSSSRHSSSKRAVSHQLSQNPL